MLSPKYYSGWYVGDFILAMKLDFFLGNAVKYLARYKNKNGMEDLRKMKSYLDRVSEFPPYWKYFPNVLQVHDEDTLNPAPIQQFCDDMGLDQAEFELLHLICQYNHSGMRFVLDQARAQAQELINSYVSPLGEVAHVSV